MELGLRGKVAIVCGSSQGIGFAIARALASEGANLTITARRAEELEKAAVGIRSETGVSVLVVPGDVSKVEDNIRVVQETVQAFGEVNILINNDGAPPVGSFKEFDDGAWDRALRQTLMSAVRMIRLTIPHMRFVGESRIINIMAASVKQPQPGLCLSVVAWAGVVGLAKTLALELGPAGITVNNICVGRIATPRLEKVLRRRAQSEGRDPSNALQEGLKDIPIARYGTPEDIAAIVTFLASGRAGFITGVTIPVDGGQVRSLI